jgi:hypothetical protein
MNDGRAHVGPFLLTTISPNLSFQRSSPGWEIGPCYFSNSLPSTFATGHTGGICAGGGRLSAVVWWGIGRVHRVHVAAYSLLLLTPGAGCRNRDHWHS